ncbi:myelin protein zero-like 1 like isoform X1 [Megalops cyprinoides]|uniref:myelin protein zero-like 1 like isoform X1 n=1 Tax=Megalops cyprinoides TaxID=118141 RepID=UPI0018652500|nr:myelin protein zero-like 1 like isoform X1 [Megalops cyprinoides]
MVIRLKNTAHLYKMLFGCAVVLLFASFPAAAIDVYTDSELLVENGTTGTLQCTFKSREVISSGASVSWTFLAEGSNASPITIFHYSGGKPYPPTSSQFKERVEWIGDLNKKDASIKLTKMQFSDNGTYACDVKNPPDIDVMPSRLQIRVVMKEALPQTNTAVIVGAVIGAIIGLILITVVTYLIIRRQESNHDYEGCTSTESISSQATRLGKKTESSSEGSRCSSPSAPVQGPVIYAQLDHSGSKSANSFHKMDPVVYADIRKN